MNGTETDPVPFSSVGIVGLGLIGGSIARGIRERWPEVRVVGTDAPHITQAACQLDVICEARQNLDELRDCEAVVLATPVPQIAVLLKELAELEFVSIVTDVGSTKRQIMRAAGEQLAFVGGHPIAGSARSGLEHARGDLFNGRPWLLVPGSVPETAIGRLERLVRGLGAVPRRIDAETHDRVMAYVSHLPQLLSNSLMSTAGRAVGASGLAVSGRGFADMTRLSSSPAEIWQGILTTNSDYIREALRVFLAELPSDAHLSDAGEVRAAFRRANEWFEILTGTKHTHEAQGDEAN
jgi:prephenate dehydrogenase